MTYNECDTDLCSLPDVRCGNRQIQKKKPNARDSNVNRFMTESKGWGIRTKKSIKPGDFIMEYLGEVVSEKEFKLRMLTEYVEDTHHYCLHLDGGTGNLLVKFCIFTLQKAMDSKGVKLQSKWIFVIKRYQTRLNMLFSPTLPEKAILQC